MTQFVLLILPEHDDEKARAVGPFLAEHLAKQWANARDIAHPLRLIMPLEEVKRSVFGQGRHALIPSPEPRAGHPAAEDLAAGGRPMTSWIEEHADQLRRFAPTELPEHPKEIDQ